jgi:hypothetical protein
MQKHTKNMPKNPPIDAPTMSATFELVVPFPLLTDVTVLIVEL